MARVVLEKGFYFFHEGIEELVGVTLDHGVDGLSFVVDEGLAELFGGDASFIAVFKTGEYILQLIDFVFVQQGFVGFRVDGDEVFAEGSYHEQLLHQSVDVAGRSKVL